MAGGSTAAIGENWTCPYCGHAQVVSEGRFSDVWEKIWVRECEAGQLACHRLYIVCANTACRRLSFEISLHTRQDVPRGGQFKLISNLEHWRLLPASFAK